jgi:O-antigen/teichoic acid export membrane protein
VSGGSLFRSFSGLISARLSGAVAQALLLFLFARQVDPSTFALVMGALGLLTFASALSDLGVTAATTRETAAGRATDSLQTMNRIVAALSAGLCLLAAVGGFLASGLDQIWIQLAPFAAWLYFERLAEYRFARDLGGGKGGSAVLNLLVRRSAPAGVVALGLVVPVPPVLLLSGGYALAACLSLVFGHQRGSIGDKADRGEGTAAPLRISLPFWINSVAAQSRQLDVLIVSVVAPIAVATVYAPAGRLVSPLRLIPSTLAQAALPFLARAGDGPGPNRPWKLLSVSMLVSAAVYILVGLAADEVVRVFFGEAYAEAGSVLRVLLWGLFFASGVSVLGSYLQGTNREWAYAGVSVACACVALLGVGLGAALGGATGAAVGLSAAYVVQFAAALLVVSRILRSEGEA